MEWKTMFCMNGHQACLAVVLSCYLLIENDIVPIIAVFSNMLSKLLITKLTKIREDLASMMRILLLNDL